MAESWVKLKGDEELRPDDLIRIYAQTVGGDPSVRQLIDVERISAEIEKSDRRFRVEGYSYPDGAGRFSVKVRITSERPLVQQAGKVISYYLLGTVSDAIMKVAGGLFTMYGEIRTFADETVKDVTAAAPEIARTALTWAAAAIVGYLAVKSWKGK